MDKPFFIMMYNQAGTRAMPITEGDDGDVAFYSSYKEAFDVAENHTFCKAFGYEIFDMTDGLTD